MRRAEVLIDSEIVARALKHVRFGRILKALFPKRPERDSVRLTMRILATMWISFIFGAAAGSVIVSSFQSIGLWGIVLPLVLLIVTEIRKQLPGDLTLR